MHTTCLVIRVQRHVQDVHLYIGTCMLYLFENRSKSVRILIYILRAFRIMGLYFPFVCFNFEILSHGVAQAVLTFCRPGWL